jgi:hypothetical protein
LQRRVGAGAFIRRTIEIVVAWAGRIDRSGGARAGAEIPGALGQPWSCSSPAAAAPSAPPSRHVRGADGHTLYVGYTSETVVVRSSKSAKYSVDDFELIAVTGLPLVLITSKNVRAQPARAIDELRAKARKIHLWRRHRQPAHIMGRVQPAQWLAVVMCPTAEGAAVADVVAGISTCSTPARRRQVRDRSGAVKALATGEARSSALPNVRPQGRGRDRLRSRELNVLLAPRNTAGASRCCGGRPYCARRSQGARPLCCARRGDELDPGRGLLKERDNFGRVVRDLGRRWNEPI